MLQKLHLSPKNTFPCGFTPNGFFHTLPPVPALVSSLPSGSGRFDLFPRTFCSFPSPDIKCTSFWFNLLPQITSCCSCCLLPGPTVEDCQDSDGQKHSWQQRCLSILRMKKKTNCIFKKYNSSLLKTKCLQGILVSSHKNWSNLEISKGG